MPLLTCFGGHRIRPQLLLRLLLLLPPLLPPRQKRLLLFQGSLLKVGHAEWVFRIHHPKNRVLPRALLPPLRLD
jgi:hypothetical protein